MTTNNQRFTEAFTNLPDHYHETFSDDFLILLAGLRMYGFTIQRADEAKVTVDEDDDLWSELSHPSVWLHAPSAPTGEPRKAEPGSAAHTRLMNGVIRLNLKEQQRLLALLSDFYTNREPVSFQARLIVETIELGETCLRTQGASIRLTLDDAHQELWLKEAQTELRAFADFLIDRADTDDA